MKWSKETAGYKGQCVDKFPFCAVFDVFICAVYICVVILECCCIDDFGMSAPANLVFEVCGFTTDNVIKLAKKTMRGLYLRRNT